MYMLSDGTAAVLEKKIFIAGSWKRRRRMRQLAERLRKLGFGVYECTDRRCRTAAEIPSETAVPFDKNAEEYGEYILRCGYDEAIDENHRNLEDADELIALLPHGIDTAWECGFANGHDIPIVLVGTPRKGEAAPTHVRSKAWYATDRALIAAYVQEIAEEDL